MLKNRLQKFTRRSGAEMSAAAEVQDITRELIRWESRGPGDTLNAMRRLAVRYGVPFSFFWSWRYRPPADLLTGTWRRLLEIRDAELRRQEALLQHERLLTKALKDEANQHFVRAAAFVARAQDRQG